MFYQTLFIASSTFGYYYYQKYMRLLEEFELYKIGRDAKFIQMRKEMETELESKMEALDKLLEQEKQYGSAGEYVLPDCRWD